MYVHLFSQQKSSWSDKIVNILNDTVFLKIKALVDRDFLENKIMIIFARQFQPQ